MPEDESGVLIFSPCAPAWKARSSSEAVLSAHPGSLMPLPDGSGEMNDSVPTGLADLKVPVHHLIQSAIHVDDSPEARTGS